MLFRLIIFILLVSPTLSEAKDLSGIWNGYFQYGHGANQRGSGFTMVLTQSDSKITAKIIETEPGTKVQRVLSADVVGQVDGLSLEFTKTYDGSGERTHSVNYELSIIEEGQIMIGTWNINKQVSGPVVFRRVQFSDLQDYL